MLGWLSAHGSHHEIGCTLGRWGAEACHRHLVPSPAWAHVMAYRNHPDVAAIRRMVHRAFPWIEHELKGMAEGLNLPLDEVFLWNCRGDLWALAPGAGTTVQGPQRLSHRQDGDPVLAEACALADIRPIDAPAFISLVCPGSLPGHTFAVNRAGFATAVSAIHARGTAPGLPRMVLARALMTQQTPQQAIELLRSQPRMGAFHVALGHAGDACTWSVESSQETVSIQEIGQRPLAHANHALHPQQAALDQTVTASSSWRQNHADALIRKGRAPLDILADQTGKAPTEGDTAQDHAPEHTLATVDIDLSGETAQWAVYAPAIAEPAMRFNGLRRA